MHPDLQVRLSHFLLDLVKKKKVTIILATHSTAFLSALESFEDTGIEFMSVGQRELRFKKISNEYRKILPIFGAHPLSNIFNQTPIWLVEGDDDERIWQQVVRTSNGAFKVYPCSVEGINNMEKYETDVVNIINSVYNDAHAYSLRDKDDSDGNIEDMGPIKCFKLSCRAAENLLLSTEVLNQLTVTWESLKDKINDWVSNEKNSNHPHYDHMIDFQKSGFDRKNHDLKEIRNDLMSLIGSRLTWEVAVGKTIGRLIKEDILISSNDENSLSSYLGNKIVTEINNFRRR